MAGREGLLAWLHGLDLIPTYLAKQYLNRLGEGRRHGQYKSQYHITHAMARLQHCIERMLTIKEET